MSQIPLSQGPVKISEVAIDEAQTLLSTGINEDGQTVVTQLGNVMNNVLRKTSFLLTSDGVITWNGSIITNNGNNIFLKFNQNPTAGVVTVMMPTSVLAGFPLAASQILYFKTTRAQMAASFTATASNFVVSSEGTMPANISPQSDSADDPTIFVPILARYDVGTNQAVWWVPHGIFWPQNTTSVVGSIITGTQIPNGSMMPLHRPGGTYPLGTPSLQSQEPGWALCDGAVIVNVQSPFNNTGRDTDGFPNATYSSANDRFAPQLNGLPPAWVTSFDYVRGDAVTNTGGSVLWVALSNFTSGVGSGWDPNAALPAAWSAASSYVIGDFVRYTEPSVNGSGQPVTIIYRALVANGPTATTPYDQGTSVWQRIWAIDPTENGNPFKRSGYNLSAIASPNTYVRGSFTSPSSSAAFGGENTHQLTIDELPSHAHSMQNHTHNMKNHTHSGVTTPAGTHSHFQGLGTTDNVNGNGQYAHRGGFVRNFTSIGVDAVGDHTHAFTSGGPNDNITTGPNNNTSNSTGADQFHNNEPRHMSAVYIIKIF
jgi:hypothetical protein